MCNFLSFFSLSDDLNIFIIVSDLHAWNFVTFLCKAWSIIAAYLIQVLFGFGYDILIRFSIVTFYINQLLEVMVCYKCTVL